MTPLAQTAMFLVALGMLVVTLVVHLFASGKKWGSLKTIVVQHGEALDGINSILYQENGSLSFVTKHDFDDHTKRCPIMICAKINDVKSLVQVNAEKLETDRFLGVRLEEGMKMFTHALDQQQNVTTKLGESVDGLRVQLAALEGKWDGRERRDIVRTDT